MKRARRAGASHSASSRKGASPEKPPLKNAPGSRKRKLFRIAAALFIPFLLLCVLEAGLHLAGYGYPTAFFLPATMAGKRVLVENQKFGWRFFEHAMARSPRPVVLAAQKPKDTFRIFVLGESAAFGDPQPDFGLPRMMEVLLNERFPGAHFEVVNAAMTAINSHVLLPIARDCAKHEGDLWVLYMGNNEVVGPFGGGTVFGPQAPSLTLIRSSIALKATRVGELMTGLAQALAGHRSGQAEWGGMTMFLKNKVREEDPRMSVTYAHFERNLQDILEVGHRHGVKVVVSTVASNLKDCAPFASLHRLGLTETELAEWERWYKTGYENEQAGHAAQAIQSFQKAAQIDDRFADLQFLWGQCGLALQDADGALSHFALARDYDTLRFRADTHINQLIRQVASGREKEGIVLCDGEKAIAEHSADGLPGREMLYEHVHLNFEGNYVLALSIAQKIAKLLPPDIEARSGSHTAWPSESDCAKKLLWTDWSRYEAKAAMMQRLNDPPFTSQFGHSEEMQRLRAEMEQLLPALDAAALAEYVAEYRRALQSVTNDWVLHKNLGRLQQRLGDLPGAVESWEQVTRILPQDVEAKTVLGLLLTRVGRPDEAIRRIKAALRSSPDSLPALNAYGLALAAKKDYPAALQQYAKALRLNSEFPETHLNMAAALDALGKADEARQHLRQTLVRKPNNAEALVELGKMCLSKGWVPEAITNFNQALALEPTDATAHFCLGGALASLRRWPEAKSHYEQAVRLRPDYAEARLGLGIELGRQGQHAQALEEFSEAVRLNPKLVEARLNMGIALTKTSRPEEAISQFQEVLRTEPGNAVALRYLHQLESQPKP